MAGTLKTMLENLDHFADLLALSCTVHAQDWDVFNVRRAVEWGRYFQQVYYRFQNNVPVRSAMERHLAAKNKQLRVRFKNYRDVRFGDLVMGETTLCTNLLHNGAVTPVVYKHVLELLEDSDLEKVGLDHMISQKVTAELFLSLPLFTCEGLEMPLDHPVLVTQADILRRSLQSRIRRLEDDQKLSAVGDVLCRLPEPLVYNLIAAMLLSDDTPSIKGSDPLQDLIVDWLLSKDAARTGLCNNVNHRVLARLSSRYSKFRKTYLDFLVQLGRSMEHNFDSGTWTSNAPNLCFNGYFERFRCLFRGLEDVRECTLTRLQTLKSQDGDYEVPGISIWTDILNELNKS